MASTSKGQQKKGKKQGSTLPIINAGGDRVEEETAVPFSVKEALQNDLVLDKIFSYLSVPELKVCRQVCQQWKQSTRRSLVEKCDPVRFFGKSVRFLSWKKLYRTGDMATLTTMIRTSNSSEFPVTKFMVDSSILNDAKWDRDGLEVILREFFQAIGPLVTELEMGFIDAGKLFQLDAPLNKEFPRLKTLKLTLSSKYKPTAFLNVENIIRSNLAFCQNILENAPQLSTLDMLGVCPKITDLVINLMERVVPARKIKTLYLCASFFEDHFDRLAGMGLKLTSLRVLIRQESNTGSNEAGEGWMKFLESQSDTLEVLHMHRTTATQGHQLTVSFPRMLKLKRLILESDSDPDPNREIKIKFSVLFYAKQFPALEILSLDGYESNDLEAFLNSYIQPVETVEILELPGVPNDPKRIWHAARIFPKVKKLKIPGRMAILQAVFQAWQNVEELTITHVYTEENADDADKLLTTNFKGHLPSNYRSKTELSGEPDKFLRDS